MSTYKTVRGKMVHLGRVSLAVHDDGSLMISVSTLNLGDQRMTLSEEDASAMHDLMSDVLEWESNRATTEAKFDKMADADETDIESGKLDDERAHHGR